MPVSRVLNIKTLDQLITALISYFPLLLPLYQRDLKTLAQISTVLMAYAIILGLIRSTFVNIIYTKKSDAGISPQTIYLGIAICLLPLMIQIVVSLLFFNLNWMYFLIAGILTLSGIQEVFRQILLKFELSKRATLADASFLFSMIIAVMGFFSFFDSTLILMAVSWVVGNLTSITFQVSHLFKVKTFSGQAAIASSIGQFLTLGFASLLSTSHGFMINMIFQWRNLESDLGLYRGLLFFFLPISFLINYQQIVLLPIYSKNLNHKREEFQLSLVAWLLFPFLTFAAVLWVFQDLSLSNILLGFVTGSIPVVVMYSNRINLRIINHEKMSIYLGLRVTWFLSSLITVGYLSSFSSLFFIVIISLGIEILYLLYTKYRLNKILMLENPQVLHEE